MAGSRYKVIRFDKIGGRVSQPVVLGEDTEELTKAGAELIVIDCETEDEAVEAVRDADAILTVEAKISRRIIEVAPKCQIIVRYGVSIDMIDVDAATENGILVVNVPDFCIEEVTNHAMAMLLACAKNLFILNNYTKQGQWDEAKKRQMARPVKGEILGLIGCGLRGQMMARKAAPFSLTVLGYDPYVDKSLADQAGIKMVSFAELISQSDYLSVHTYVTPETYHMVSESEFEQMKPTAFIFNTARPGVIDEAALIKALQENQIAGAGLDNFEKEPVNSDNPLLKMENVIVTPHCGGWSERATSQLRRSVAQEVIRVLNGEWPKNVVNKSVKPKYI